MHRTRLRLSQLVMIELIKQGRFKQNRLFSVLIGFRSKIHFGEVHFQRK